MTTTECAHRTGTYRSGSDRRCRSCDAVTRTTGVQRITLGVEPDDQPWSDTTEFCEAEA
jgi:hypothetical protein